jgi:hypothetical protein
MDKFLRRGGPLRPPAVTHFEPLSMVAISMRLRWLAGRIALNGQISVLGPARFLRLNTSTPESQLKYAK